MRYRELAMRELRVIPFFNGLMTWLLLQEVRLIAQRRRLPFGTSILALARKLPGLAEGGLTTGTRSV